MVAVRFLMREVLHKMSVRGMGCGRVTAGLRDS
jgi:hypothetical protein